MLVKRTTVHGSEVVIACDAKCTKAWGLQKRPSRVVDESKPDDIVWLGDGELKQAPSDPKTTVNGYGKPLKPEHRMNQWCVSECERSMFVSPNETKETHNWRRRTRNMKLHETK